MASLAGLALILPAAAPAQPTPPKTVVSKSKIKAKAKAKTKAPQAKSEAGPVLTPSPAAERVIAWVAGSHDNRGLPWAVVDKVNATIFLFAPDGKPLAAEPVLIGIMPGDEASPGVGTKTLASLGPAEKTTPAGRYLAKFGLPVGGERVLWVDYATSVALHPIPKDAGAKEKRRERMLSPTPDDNRITFGCINVPQAFYARQLRPTFRKKGGYVYILPDTKTLEEVFPRLRVQAS
ncbi:hypothetical protein [Sphingomonas fuzhouensis]|uniref:hypothetical protein n=1 Tax=Sphingomonas fuzhouensis TaxID=3106033 RepID=UPI002AFEE18B|nr:hypothetical protein [Sphingomonas sp. SGZ-02]